MFEKQEQEKEHHGGNRWVGTGGTSPSDMGASIPLVLGLGASQEIKALCKSPVRDHLNYRKDRIIDTRQLGLALKTSFLVKRSSDELDIEASIEATGKNAGEIELVF